jgi:hypothetical protein
MTRASALNLLSRLKKEGYVRLSGGGRQKRIYTISSKKTVAGENNLFDIINFYSKIKIVPLFKHEAYGDYGVENALVDAVLTKNFRVLQASLFLFNHIKNWKKLHSIARRKNVEQEIGALYDCARAFIRTRKMPENIRKSMLAAAKKIKKNRNQKKAAKAHQRKIIKHILGELATNNEKLKKISREWNILLPFSTQDMEELQ